MGFAEIVWMMPERTADTKSNETEAEKLARLLEIELIQKRAEWKQAGARRQNARVMSFAFLFLIIIGCLVGLFFAFSMVSGGRPKPPDANVSTSERPK
jgi:hypothetical protein